MARLIHLLHGVPRLRHGVFHRSGPWLSTRGAPAAKHHLPAAAQSIGEINSFEAIAALEIAQGVLSQQARQMSNPLSTHRSTVEASNALFGALSR
jgi:hypothetical protein